MESRLKKILSEAKTLKAGIFCNSNNVLSLVDKYIKNEFLDNKIKIYFNDEPQDFDKIYVLNLQSQMQVMQMKYTIRPKIKT